MMGRRHLKSLRPTICPKRQSSWFVVVPYLPPAPLTPGTQQAGRWRRPFAGSARILLLTIPARSPPLTREAAGVSLWPFPWHLMVCQTAHRVCRKRNVPVMLGIQLSRCWVIIIDYQAKSVKIVSRIFLISSGTYSNALCNASA